MPSYKKTFKKGQMIENAMVKNIYDVKNFEVHPVIFL